jgi:hypothetical protein
MKSKTSTIVMIAAISLLMCGATNAQRQHKKPDTNKPAQSADDQMKSAMANAAPGAAHAGLAKLAGEYTTVTRFIMAPGAPAQESTGEAKLWMTLDGRFLSEDDSGTFFGQPTKGFKFLGYNNASKRYEGIWTYTMSTSIMSLNGTSNDGGKTINFVANYDDENGVKQQLAILMRQVDNDHLVVELNSKTPDGKPGPKLETTYTRKK